jgi:DNA-binding NarL/FixJ family response regulator
MLGEKNRSIKLMLVVPSNLFRDGIHRLLEPEKDIQIIAETSTHIEAISLIEQKHPDVIFIDTATADIDVAKILEPLKQKNVETKILFIAPYHR